MPTMWDWDTGTALAKYYGSTNHTCTTDCDCAMPYGGTLNDWSKWAGYIATASSTASNAIYQLKNMVVNTNFTFDVELDDLTPVPVTKPLSKNKQPLPPPRKRAPLEFNKYINASDLMEEFIRSLGAEGVRQREVLDLPIDLFIKWLIIKACEADAEVPNVTLEIPKRTLHRCLGCGRFMKKGLALPMHDAKCYNFYSIRTEADIGIAV